jgi:hypothetical protein
MFTAEKAVPILATIDEIEAKQAEIARLDQAIDELKHQVTGQLWKEFPDWKPYLDEMAVMFSPGNNSAMFVWFIEEVMDCYRFKETPSFDTTINNYVRQPIVPETDGGELIVLPVQVFEVLNRTLKIKIYNKYESIQRSKMK